ncbi:MAG TPA: biotin carboxylase N-terminal domain-containing protein [Xanthobacteraceae bacterium]|nr:biotin carboxylase N-terminal domain-containing protein [Xanthobacteraceae bacterium]
MFSSVLIANRGEIACRIARTARRLGMRVVAVYSEADRNAPHVRLADEAHPIGPAPARESYLVIERLIEVARKAAAECVHPGYGFLAENAAFAEACAAAGVVFVGPPPAAIRAMGLKDQAKRLMEKAGVPVVPGYHGAQQDAASLKKEADRLGYPLLIKAAAGGGGKGMRRVEAAAEFFSALEAAQREAVAAFSEGRVILEKYIDKPRHIEMQVFADAHGNCIHLNERDCSLQRRYQKVIEEAPAPGMTAALREEMGAAAVRAAKAVGYVGAGTVEFIADGTRGLKSGSYWFMEMNTRLQVEHPVTEAITGLDLVEWQFRVAAGEKLSLGQNQVLLNGHAVEARIYAEDPARGFLPSTGKLLALEFPEGVRIDTGVEAGAQVSPHYDPLIAKLIAHAATREVALAKLADALERTVIAGPRSNAGFLAALVRAEEVRAGRIDTGLIDRNLVALVPSGIDCAAAACGAATLLRQEMARIAQSIERADDASPSPWEANDGFSLSGPRVQTIPILVDGVQASATIRYGGDGPVVAVDGAGPALDARTFATADGVLVVRGGWQSLVQWADRVARDFVHADGDGTVKAPMHGRLLALFVAQGDKVAKGQRLAIIEAMKMEHTIAAPCAGTVAEINTAAGAQVAEGARLMTIAPENGKRS